MRLNNNESSIIAKEIMKIIKRNQDKKDIDSRIS